MSLKKIIFFWLIIFFIFFILWQLTKEKPLVLPLIEKPQIAKVYYRGKAITFEKKQENWQLEGKNVAKFAEFLQSLKTACKGEFEAKDFDIKEDIDDVFLILDDKQTLQFSINNPVFAANILKIEQKIYFCPESFKARLIQGKNYWNEK